jgi:hypothetical protein
MENMEFLKAMLAEMNAKMGITQETTKRQIGSLVSITETTRKTDRDEIKHEIRADQEHIKETMETQFASLAAKLDRWRKEMPADQEASKTMDVKANPDEMEPNLEHRKVPNEDAAVEGRKKWHRCRKVAAGRRGEPKELTPRRLWIQKVDVGCRL